MYLTNQIADNEQDRPVEVTRAMIEAGADVISEYGSEFDPYVLARRVFETMAAQAGR
jgi:hypothetical protein